ncbi:Gfo/Idh/MocA family protein [Paenibacillus koleovorans]|uniref:Gfo/Idh/MocA family protein n=1 Tax=Paenibacillus koleovorans TaxID=121608 RepID=UPI0013E29A47|nr:Gfo/Idh/MocA family oxidoreductase [Paenibacillus koleovorans]
MNRIVKLGVVGCGAIAQHHLKHATGNEGIEVVAVADVREEAARATAAKFGIAHAYTDAEELFDNPEVEGVILALQTRFRTELALRAFAKGKHVLLEKPAAMNADEVRRMIAGRGALSAGCCSSRFRFFASAVAAAEFVRSGALGELRLLRSRNLAPATPPKDPPLAWQYSREANGGGVLADWGVYDLDYLLGITGWTLRPEHVFARVWYVPPAFESFIAAGSDGETHVSATIACQGGPLISYERGALQAAKREHAWQLVGTNGSLDLYLLPQEEKEIVFHAASKAEGVVSRTIWKGTESWAAVHAGPVVDFAASIREGRQPSTSLEHALTVQEIVDAIYMSSESGGLIAVRPVDYVDEEVRTQ